MRDYIAQLHWLILFVFVGFTGCLSKDEPQAELKESAEAVQAEKPMEPKQTMYAGATTSWAPDSSASMRLEEPPADLRRSSREPSLPQGRPRYDAIKDHRGLSEQGSADTLVLGMPAQATEQAAERTTARMKSGKARAMPGQKLAATGMGANNAVSVPPARADKNGWYQNTYLAGTGSRESLEKAVTEGVMVDGARVKLEAFTGSYKQDFPFPSKNALGVTVRSDRSKIVASGGTVFLEVGFQAASREGGDRPDLNVVMVIDTSGSMSSEGKIQAVRAAAKEVVDHLSDRDRLAVVTYSSRAEVIRKMAPIGVRAELKATIARIAPGGSTNIYAALEAAYAEGRKASRPQAGNLVILLTDGKVTAGERRNARFETLIGKAADDDIETTAIGMGVEYNEELMMKVAQAGGGNYHFIQDSSAVSGIISKELDDLAKSIARGVRLRVVVPDGVDLVRVMGSEKLSQEQATAVKAEERKIDQKIYEELGITRDRKDQDEPGIKMLIPSFKANDSHIVLMELWVPPGSGDLKLAEVHVKYKDMLNKTNAELDSSLTVAYAKDKSESVASINQSVKKNMLGFETGETLMTAARLVSQGDFARAIRQIDDQMVKMGVAAREWRDADLERDGMLLGKYKDVLTAYARKGRDPALAAYLGKSFSYSAYQRLK